MRRYVAAAALQRLWRTRLSTAIGDLPLISPAYLDDLQLPSLDDDHGQMTLWTLAQQESLAYGYNAWAGYESLMELILAEMDTRRWGVHRA
jgi:hypothetical protein